MTCVDCKHWRTYYELTKEQIRKFKIPYFADSGICKYSLVETEVRSALEDCNRGTGFEPRIPENNIDTMGATLSHE